MQYESRRNCLIFLNSFLLWNFELLQNTLDINFWKDCTFQQAPLRVGQICLKLSHQSAHCVCFDESKAKVPLVAYWD
jgi:hypothetical protein